MQIKYVHDKAVLLHTKYVKRTKKISQGNEHNQMYVVLRPILVIQVEMIILKM